MAILASAGGALLGTAATAAVTDTTALRVKSIAVSGVKLAAIGGAAWALSPTNKAVADARGALDATSDANYAAAAAAIFGEDKHPYHKIYIVNNFQGQDPMVVRAWLPEQVALDVSAQFSPLFSGGIFSGSSLVDQGARAFGFSGLTREMSFKVWQSSQGISMVLPLVFALDDHLDEIDNGNPDILTPIIELQKLCLPSLVPGTVGFLQPPGTVVKVKKDALETLGQAAGEVLSTVSTAVMNPVDTVVDLSEAAADAMFGDNESQESTNTFYEKTSETLVGVAKIVASALESIFEFQSWTSIYVGNFLYFDKVVVEQVGTTYDMQMDKYGKPIRATVNVQFSTLFDTTVQDLNSIYLTGKPTKV